MVSLAMVWQAVAGGAVEEAAAGSAAGRGPQQAHAKQDVVITSDGGMEIVGRAGRPRKRPELVFMPGALVRSDLTGRQPQAVPAAVPTAAPAAAPASAAVPKATAAVPPVAQTATGAAVPTPVPKAADAAAVPPPAQTASGPAAPTQASQAPKAAAAAAVPPPAPTATGAAVPTPVPKAAAAAAVPPPAQTAAGVPTQAPQAAPVVAVEPRRRMTRHGVILVVLSCTTFSLLCFMQGMRMCPSTWSPRKIREDEATKIGGRG